SSWTPLCEAPGSAASRSPAGAPAVSCSVEEDRDMSDFTALPDLASRQLAGSVIAANDELFAERENLIRPESPTFSVHEFGHKGKVYDGWETRRRREPGHDWAIVRLGLPGMVRGVVVDTAFFKGNYPPEGAVAG